MKDKTTAVADRRAFLKLAGTGVVAGGAVLASGTAAEAGPKPEKEKAELYRETEHVKRYYELARF
ncbi:MAG: formate dehydrogenase [Hyphomicrobiaceae bacterium]